MPNIEIWGIRGLGQIESLEKKIIGLFKGAPYAPEVVLTWTNQGSYVVDLQGANNPYLRISGTQGYLDRHLPDLLYRLKPLSMDIEILVLKDFFSKDELAKLQAPE